MVTERLLQSILEAEGAYEFEALDIEFYGYVDASIRRKVEVDSMEDGHYKDFQRDIGERADSVYVQSTLAGRPPREWVLLKSLQGHSRLAVTYGGIGHFDLQYAQLGQGRRVLDALRGGHDSIVALPTQFALLKGALNDFILTERLKALRKS